MNILKHEQTQRNRNLIKCTNMIFVANISSIIAVSCDCSCDGSRGDGKKWTIPQVRKMAKLNILPKNILNKTSVILHIYHMGYAWDAHILQPLVHRQKQDTHGQIVVFIFPNNLTPPDRKCKGDTSLTQF